MKGKSEDIRRCTDENQENNMKNMKNTKIRKEAIKDQN